MWLIRKLDLNYDLVESFSPSTIRPQDNPIAECRVWPQKDYTLWVDRTLTQSPLTMVDQVVSRVWLREHLFMFRLVTCFTSLIIIITIHSIRRKWSICAQRSLQEHPYYGLSRAKDNEMRLINTNIHGRVTISFSGHLAGKYVGQQMYAGVGSGLYSIVLLSVWNKFSSAEQH